MGLSSKEVNMMKTRLKWGSVQTEKSFLLIIRTMAYYIMYSITKEIENNTLNKKGKLVHMADDFRIQ